MKNTNLMAPKIVMLLLNLMLGAGVIILAIGALVAYWPRQAHADQSYLSVAETQNSIRACSLAGATPKNITVSGTSAVTSATVGRGKMRVVCSSVSYMKQGAYGSTGATATTGGVRLPADLPEDFYNPGNNFIAFIQATTGGTCQIAECQ